MDSIEGNSVHLQNDLAEEMRELRRLRTAAMVEKCSGKNQVIVCPKPRRQQHLRYCWDQNDAQVGSELSDILASKASPPYYSISPPVRATNPLIQDARFHEQNPTSFGVNSGGVENQRTQSIPTMG